MKGSPTDSLTVQVAELGLKDDARLKQKMLKDGFLDKWGPRRQSEWVLKEVTDIKKQKKYA